MVEQKNGITSLKFSEFDRRAATGETLSVVFLGGSLTWGAQATDPLQTSYRARIQKRMAETYPLSHFHFGDAAIGGTGSQLAAFRLDRDVFSNHPDLVFLDFTINDNPYVEPSPSRLASYESLIRRLILEEVPVVQVILPSKQDVEANPPPRPLDAEHKAIGTAYGLPLADAVVLAKERVTHGLTTADCLWDLPEDGTHPGDEGYALYAEAVWDAFQQAISGNRACCLPEGMLHADTYMSVNRFRIAGSPSLPDGWRVGKPHRNAVAFDFVCSRWMDGLVIADPDADRLRIFVQGCDVILFGEMTKKSGSFQYRIDGGDWETCSAHCADGNMRMVELMAEGLDPAREHELEIFPDLQPDEELRIECICVAGDPARVSFRDE